MNAKHLAILSALLLAATAFGLYLPILNGEFVYDSRAQILVDTYIHDLRHAGDVLTLRILSLDAVDNARPLHVLSLILDAALWQKNPFGYHLTSNLMHTGNTVLLFWVLLRLTMERRTSGCLSKESPWLPVMAAFLPALLFAVHPIQSETVCEVSYREDLLVTFCLLLGINLAGLFEPRRCWKSVWVAVACGFSFFLAATAKETAVAGPFTLLFWWLLFRRQAPRKGWILLIAAVFIAVFGFFAVRQALLPELPYPGRIPPVYLGGSFSQMLTIQPSLWAFALSLLVWPMNLCADYGPYSIRNFTLIPSLILLAVVLTWAVWMSFRDRRFAWGALLFALTLAPVSNFLPLFCPFADRFLYLPMAGLAAMLAALLMRAFESGLRNALAVFNAVALALVILAGTAFAAVTIQRETVWQNGVSLWSDAWSRNPQSVRVANNRAFSLYDAKNYSLAVTCWQQAAQLSGMKYAEPLAGLAIGLDALGQSAEADRVWRQAIRLDPSYMNPDGLVRQLRWDPQHAEGLKVIVERNRGVSFR